MVSTARIERPPLYRGDSASIETIPATSLSSSQTARCTSTGCQQPPDLPLNSHIVFTAEWPDCPSLDASRDHQASNCSLQARLLSLHGWGLIDLPLRTAFSPAHPLARRDVPLAQARAFHYLSLPLGEWPRLPFTARIERPLLYRGGSASKKGTWPLHPHPSEAARCASTDDHQAPSPPLFREHRTNVGILPARFIVRVLRSRRMVWLLPAP